MEDFDAVVIGAGQAGPFLAAKLAHAGRRVALVERRRLGGTCVNDGCIPTKTLIASARAAWVARNAARWGVRAGEVTVDMPAVKARKDAVVGESRASLQSWLGPMPNLTLIDGHARFVSPTEVRVGDRHLRGRTFFLNTGARATLPSIPGLADVGSWTNTEMMDVDTLPAHLLVLGGSYVGLEFAQMYARFGSRVTVLERGADFLSREDRDVAAAIASFLRDEGIDVRTGVRVRAFERVAGGLRATLEGGGVVEASNVLVATGRVPNADDLGLDLAGVRRDARGYVEVDDELRTSQPHIYALGDVNGRGAFTHTSYNDFEIVEGNLLHGGKRRVSDRIPIYAIYVDPPLGRVGMSEAQARASGRRVLRGLRPMTRVGRAKERSETLGLIKILVDEGSEQILGASLLGIEADEAMHGIADVMYARARYTVLRDAVHAHPTVSELIPTVLQSLEPLEGPPRA